MSPWTTKGVPPPLAHIRTHTLAHTPTHHAHTRSRLHAPAHPCTHTLARTLTQVYKNTRRGICTRIRVLIHTHGFLLYHATRFQVLSSKCLNLLRWCCFDTGFGGILALFLVTFRYWCHCEPQLSAWFCSENELAWGLNDSSASTWQVEIKIKFLYI